MQLPFLFDKLELNNIFQNQSNYYNISYSTVNSIYKKNILFDSTKVNFISLGKVEVAKDIAILLIVAIDKKVSNKPEISMSYSVFKNNQLVDFNIFSRTNFGLNFNDYNSIESFIIRRDLKIINYASSKKTLYRTQYQTDLDFDTIEARFNHTSFKVVNDSSKKFADSINCFINFPDEIYKKGITKRNTSKLIFDSTFYNSVYGFTPIKLPFIKNLAIASSINFREYDSVNSYYITMKEIEEPQGAKKKYNLLLLYNEIFFPEVERFCEVAVFILDNNYRVIESYSIGDYSILNKNLKPQIRIPFYKESGNQLIIKYDNKIKKYQTNYSDSPH